MDPSSVLRQQSQNAILRTMNEQNKMTAEPKSSKSLSLQALKQNLQNHDPGRSGQVRPPHHLRPAVSRLPVLAKSLHLQTPNEFTQSHCKWENKPLSGKVKTKKPCTRPVPFNLSQPKASRVASENQPPNAHNPARNLILDKNVCSSQFKTTNRNVKHSTKLKENVKSPKLTENTPQALGKSRHPQKTSAKPVPFALNAKESSAAASEQPASAAEACLENMNLLSLKDTASISMGDKVDNFQHDHAALLSILCNEGVSSAMTPLPKLHNYLPQRVSIMKSRQKAEPKPGSMKSVQFSPDHRALRSILKNEGVKAGVPSDRAPSIYTPMRVPVKKNSADKGAGLSGTSIKTVQFSPDAAALQSILQNEGVKAVGPDFGTPRNSVCPSRNTSVYTAQRVPVRKNLAGLAQTPGQKWTPLRVTRHQPMSAKKWHTSSQQSPYGTPSGLTGYKANHCTEQEEVVQKLFVEDEPVKDDVSVPPTDSPQDQTAYKEEMQNPVGNEEKEHGLMNEDDRAVRPFLQAPERESVIFFSTGKKLFRDPRFKNPEKKGEKQHLSEESLPVLQHSWKISATAQSHASTKDLLIQKTGVTSVTNPAVAMLRKRLPPLEELRLDEEVATYTSVSVPTMSGFHTPRPHCGNPLATLFHSEESTRFVPICLDISPDSPHEG